MDKLALALEWLKAHWDVISFVVLFLTSEILPKVQKVEANSVSELIPEVIKLIFKLVKKDYSVEKKDSSVEKKDEESP